MSQKFNHFHLVRNRPWPLLASLTAGMITYSTILMITSKGNFYFFFSISLSTLVGILWWRDVIRESTQEGSHTYYVVGGLKVGIIMFIISEILFFVSFFWAYLHSRISPRLELGAHWPPLSISTFNPMGIPLLNTVILLSSGVRVTWSHHSIENSKLLSSKTSIVFTIFFGDFVHSPPGNRIPASPIFYLRLRFWNYVFSFYGIPRNSCNHWDFVFGSLF